MNKDCSEEFYDAFSAGWGSNWVTCACGRSYMTTHINNIAEEEDYLFFEQMCKEKPDMYIDTYNQGVSMINLGQDYVDGCACGNVYRYEQWIWTHRDSIMKYIKARSAKEVVKVQEELQKLAEYAGE